MTRISSRSPAYVKRININFISYHIFTPQVMSYKTRYKTASPHTTLMTRHTSPFLFPDAPTYLDLPDAPTYLELPGGRRCGAPHWLGALRLSVPGQYEAVPAGPLLGMH